MQRAVVELETRKPEFRRKLRADFFAPAKSPGDHEMDDGEYRLSIARELENDALSDASKGLNRQSFDRVNRRIKRAQHERADDTKALQLVTGDALSQA